jgi:putative endonuclease
MCGSDHLPLGDGLREGWSGQHDQQHGEEMPYDGLRPVSPYHASVDSHAKEALRRAAERRGLHAEELAAEALAERGWTILARRVRTPLGELDLIAEREGLLAFIEVKARPTLAEAAFSLSPRQQQRLMAAAEAWLASNPGHGETGIRFDVILVAPEGLRRIADAFRAFD